MSNSTEAASKLLSSALSYDNVVNYVIGHVRGAAILSMGIAITGIRSMAIELFLKAILVRTGDSIESRYVIISLT